MFTETVYLLTSYIYEGLDQFFIFLQSTNGFVLS